MCNYSPAGNLWWTWANILCWWKAQASAHQTCKWISILLFFWLVNKTEELLWKVIYLKKRMHSEFWLLWVRFIWDLGFPKYKISMLYAVALWFPGHLGFREELSYMFNISKTRLGFHGVDLKCQGVSSPEERLPWYIISSELSVHLVDLLQLYWYGKEKKIPSSCQILLIAPVWIQCLKNSLAWWTSSLSEMWESSFQIAPPSLAEQGAGFKTLHTLK